MRDPVGFREAAIIPPARNQVRHCAGTEKGVWHAVAREPARNKVPASARHATDPRHPVPGESHDPCPASEQGSIVLTLRV